MPAAETTVTHQRIGSSERLRVPKTAELVAAELRRRIVRGDLKEGDLLPPEASLMRSFGVSRPTLREAFRVLESESLLTVRRGAHGGAQVHVPGEESAARYLTMVLEHRSADAADVRHSRDAIETMCVSALADRADAAALETLNTSLRATEASIGDPAAFAAATSVFHRTLVAAAGSATLSVLWEVLRLAAASATPDHAAPVTAPADEVAARRVIHAHQTVIDLIVRGDSSGAREHWHNHLRGNRSRNTGAADVIGLLG
jgi:DNA-binding FadR family transcriptional regulator